MATIEGNILTLKRGIIAQQVNCQGVMGSGVAKAIRDMYPIVWTEYSKICNPVLNSRLMAGSAGHLGKLLMVPLSENGQLWCANIFGQNEFRTYGSPEGVRYTSYDAVDEALKLLTEWNLEVRLPIHYPLLGSDRGGAHWPVVKAIINHRLSEFEHHLWILPGAKEPT